MLKSMTGFGRGEYASEDYRFIVEIKSVNHRYLDINAKLPRNLFALEEKIIKLVKEHLARGKVDVFLNSFSVNGQDDSSIIDENRLTSFVESIQRISDSLGLADDITASTILSISENFIQTDTDVDIDKVWDLVSLACKEAIDKLLKMRQIEASEILKDLLLQLEDMEAYLDKIKDKSPFLALEYKEKFEGRLNELLADKKDLLDEDRLAQEVAIFADKASVDEEIVRLRSHFIQAREILQKGGVCGRQLDFLAQEMNREANTIGSKSYDQDISKNVIGLKSEIEKFREQIQNIE